MEISKLILFHRETHPCTLALFSPDARAQQNWHASWNTSTDA
jgi:hypothetical protein